MRKQYVSKYVAALQANPDKITIDNNKEIQNLDRELDAGIILQWRCGAPRFGFPTFCVIFHLLLGMSQVHVSSIVCIMSKLISVTRSI